MERWRARVAAPRGRRSAFETRACGACASSADRRPGRDQPLRGCRSSRSRVRGWVVGAAGPRGDRR
ncbi:phage DNA packaging protein J [Nocardia rhizosphaerae]|uniref:Phage DNA packaging protein J n=1 Tax=Nocardia rhizosphaerae TaxID=1691571 RepID=A0ABV8L4E2_9NOCA